MMVSRANRMYAHRLYVSEYCRITPRKNVYVPVLNNGPATNKQKETFSKNLSVSHLSPAASPLPASPHARTNEKAAEGGHRQDCCHRQCRSKVPQLAARARRPRQRSRSGSVAIVPCPAEAQAARRTCRHAGRGRGRRREGGGERQGREETP